MGFTQLDGERIHCGSLLKALHLPVTLCVRVRAEQLAFLEYLCNTNMFCDLSLFFASCVSDLSAQPPPPGRVGGGGGGFGGRLGFGDGAAAWRFRQLRKGLAKPHA